MQAPFCSTHARRGGRGAYARVAGRLGLAGAICRNRGKSLMDEICQVNETTEGIFTVTQLVPSQIHHALKSFIMSKYLSMSITAIQALKERGGSSGVAIKKVRIIARLTSSPSSHFIQFEVCILFNRHNVYSIPLPPFLSFSTSRRTTRT